MNDAERRGKTQRELLGLERGRETMWLPLTCPLLGTWPTTQACALTENQTSDPLVCRPALNPLSYTSWGIKFVDFYEYIQGIVFLSQLYYSPRIMRNWKGFFEGKVVANVYFLLAP